MLRSLTSFALVVCIFLAVGVAVLGGFIIWRSYDHATESARNQLRDEARLLTAAGDAKLSESIGVLETFSKLPALQRADYASANEYVNSLGSPAALNAVGWVDTTGYSRVASPPVPPVFIGDREYIAIPLREGRMAVSAAILGRGTGRPLIVIGVPTFDSGGSPIGVAAGNITLDSIVATITQTAPAGRRFTVVDKSGQTLVLNGEIAKLEDQTGSSWYGAAGASDGVITGDGATGRNQVIAYATSPAAAWKVFVEAPEGAIYASARRSLRIEAAGLGFACLIIIAAGTGLGVIGERRYREKDRAAQALEETAADLRVASSAKDEFLSLVSHELKTPVTTIMGNAWLLRSRWDGIADGERQQALDDVHENAHRLAGIVDGLLDLARVERGITVEHEPVPLSRAAANIAAEHRRGYPDRVVNLDTQGEVLVLGVTSYVEQVIRNFLSNAEKYSPAGRPIDVFVHAEGDEGVVRVVDHGSGVPQMELNAVFEPFYRSKQTATKTQGMGVGLALCKRLVEAMGGTINARNVAPAGAQFSFRLGLVAEQETLDPEAGVAAVAVREGQPAATAGAPTRAVL